MEELTRLIREDMKPALGVTEPGCDRICDSTGESRDRGRSAACGCGIEFRHV